MCIKQLQTRTQGVIPALLLALAMTMALPAFADSDANSSEGQMALLLSTTNNPYFAAMKRAAQNKAEDLNVDFQVLDAHNDSNQQVSQIQTLLAKQVDMLLVNPTNADAITPAIKQANKAGVPVIFVDRATNGGESLAFFASDNVQAGKTACQYLVDQMDGEGSLAILTGVPGASATNERSSGCDQVLNEHDKIDVVARQSAHFDRSEGLNVMQNMLTANPQGIDAVFAENDEMALGAIKALKSAHALDNTLVASIDGTPGGRKAVKAGEIDLNVAQQPALMSKSAVATGYQYLKTDRLFIPVPLQKLTQDK
ncbi:substrate-binding domain-containing protein [Salinisphaera orenii]|uniref:substrate-binding domain-containing protein n=1 Tax=Salinisphaera orenii TaxID=856731 RepID=UPI0019551324